MLQTGSLDVNSMSAFPLHGFLVLYSGYYVFLPNFLFAKKITTVSTKTQIRNYVTFPGYRPNSSPRLNLIIDKQPTRNAQV